MTKLDWKKTEDEKKARRHGSSKVFMDEMPVSWEEVVASLVPKRHSGLLKQFVRSVIVADINGTGLPLVPKKLQRYIQNRIEMKGGVLEFAKWLADYDSIAKTEARKDLEKRRNIEKQFLHRVAKYAIGIVSLDNALQSVPEFLTGDIKDRKSLLQWAESQPDYGKILAWKKAHPCKARKVGRQARRKPGARP